MLMVNIIALAWKWLAHELKSYVDMTMLTIIFNVTPSLYVFFLQRIPDVVTLYFRNSGFPVVFLSVQHRPMLSWGVQLYVSPSGVVRFKEG